MPALVPDYDSDPERWASHDRSIQLCGDVHEIVAARIIADELGNVLDVGCGNGRLRDLLPSGRGWIGVASSPTQLAPVPRGRVALADAARLPFREKSFDVVAALWMLYHLDAPGNAIAEARRVLLPGGLFFACTSSRANDPELTDGYPPTHPPPSTLRRRQRWSRPSSASPVSRSSPWDAPLVHLADRPALMRYLRSHHPPESTADRVQPPLYLTNGAAWSRARKDG